MKYLIIGAGGTGGLIGGYLAKKQHDVTLIARGEHLKAIQNKGLTIKTYGEAPVCIKNIKATSEQQIGDQKFDVIFVCVKAYDLKNIISVLKRSARPVSIIIPILNSLGAGHTLGIVVLGNTNDIRSQRLAEQVGDLFLPAAPNMQAPAVNPADTILATLKDNHLSPLLGNYISDDLTAFKVAIRNGKAVLQYETGGMTLLVPVNANAFAAFGHPEVTYTFSQHHITQTWPERKREFTFYDPAPLTDAQLTAYTGTYNCPELECTYHIVLKDHQLWLSGSKDEDIPLKLYGKDRLTNTSWFMPNLQITRGSKGHINGFEVSTERVNHLSFGKL